VLALHRLDVRSASAFSREGTAVTVFRVTPRFGSPPDWAVVRNDLLRAVDGSLPLEQKLAAKEAAYARRTSLPVAPPTVRMVDDASESATVVEVRAPDGLGILHRITAALDACGLDVRTAHISTLGADVVDAFYVVGPDGKKVDEATVRQSVEQRILDALTPAGTRRDPLV
jgi:[protein-PII] uridylyltransferase